MHVPPLEPPAGRPGLSLVKLGGSVLTRKRAGGGVRAKLLDQLLRELATSPGPVVLLHGAGSFGHPGAARWGLAVAPVQESRRQRDRGAAIVAREVRVLHAAVLAAAVRRGLPAFSFPPLGLAENQAGRLEEFQSAGIVRCLDRGGLPVSFGDVVPDRLWGWSILSADTIAAHLVPVLRPRRVLFVSDVPGILPPGPGRPRPIARPTAETVELLRPADGARDVTGGIRGKLEAMLAIAKAGADAALISGLSAGTLSGALRGERVYGSWVDANTS